jgi:hypothetical protein
MSRQPRPLPARVGRLNYWSYEFAHPEATKDPPPPSASRTAHAKILNTFRQIRDDVGVAKRYHPRFQEDLMRMGIDDPTPALLALAYYLTTDRLWSQDHEAMTLLTQQPPEFQRLLRTWARGVWRRRTPGSWDTLLRTIARDQALFQEICSVGPTRAGLVATQWQDGSPIWKKYGVSEADAQRVYRAYHRKMSELLGRGVIVSKVVRAAFRARGIDVPRIRPTRTMAGLQELPPDEQTAIILHWFAHALRNLARYRDGHAPISWHPTECRQRCLKIQHDLKA